MRILLLCATARGLRVLERLRALAPDDDLIVCSFREEPVEPPFLDAIRASALAAGARFHEVRHVGKHEEILAGGVDLLLAVSWRYLVPPAIHTQAHRGAYVIHDSLLPAYRGFSPTVWAIANREPETGATLFAMSEPVDAGDIVDQRRIPIGREDRVGDVMQRLTDAYLDLLEANLGALRAGTARRTAQDHSRASYCRRRTIDDNAIGWDAPADHIHALIRAVTRPYAGAFTRLSGHKLTIWDAERVPANASPDGKPGEIVSVVPGRGALVRAGDGTLLLTEVQLEGGLPQNAGEVLTGAWGTVRLGRELAAT